MTVEQAVRAVREAVLNEGPRPDVHRAQLARLEREWPTLASALRQLVSATDEASWVAGPPGLEFRGVAAERWTRYIEGGR